MLKSTTSFAQETVHARFIIQDARNNKVDVSQQVVKQGGFLAIYTHKDDNTIYLANVIPGQKSQSYGAIYDLKITEEPQTSNSYETETFDFKWSYANSYDNKEGTSSVQLVKIKKAAGIAFTCTLITEDLDVIVYKGYMEGSLNKILN